MLSNLKGLGFWTSSRDKSTKQYIDPKEIVSEEKPNYDKSALISYLKNGYKDVGDLGCSYCRFHCGIENSEMGSCEITDGEFVWPEGFSHYVEFHNIIIPEYFLNHVISNNYLIPKKDLPFNNLGIDLKEWKIWCKIHKKSFYKRMIKKLGFWTKYFPRRVK